LKKIIGLSILGIFLNEFSVVCTWYELSYFGFCEHNPLYGFLGKYFISVAVVLASILYASFILLHRYFLSISRRYVEYGDVFRVLSYACLYSIYPLTFLISLDALHHVLILLFRIDFLAYVLSNPLFPVSVFSVSIPPLLFRRFRYRF